MDGDLDRRIPLRGSGDEFDQLARTLNTMLERNSELVRNLRMTTGSLSHDLRSPLTRLRAQIDQLADSELSEPDRVSLAGRAMHEVDLILSVFANLTEIARADAGIGRADFEVLDLGHLVSGIAGFYQPVAEERQISLRIETEPVRIVGHAALLQQAVSNLLENALRHAPDGSELIVRSGKDDWFAQVSVSDQGAGIAPGDRERVLKPFVTLDPSRGDGSSGLGLALVASVVRLHQGEVSLLDNAPGLIVRMRFPASVSMQ
jgi:signal transduction histidine kinase